MTQILTAAPTGTDTIPEVQQITTTRAEIAQLVDEIVTLRHRAGELTAEAAGRHDWCDYAERAVLDAGCHWPSNEVTFDLTISLRVTCDVHSENRMMVNDGWTESSLNIGDVCSAVNLDGDWDTDTLNVELNSHSVSNVQMG